MTDKQTNKQTRIIIYRLIGQKNPIADVTGCIVADDGLQEGGEGQGGDAGGQGGQAGGDPLHI